MDDPSHFDVFLSYSHRDRREVLSLAQRLQSDGLCLWFDEWNVQPDGRLSADINRGLDRATVLVLCLSANSSKSPWRRLETQTFLFRNRHKANRRVVVLRLDDSAIDQWLDRFDVIDWRQSVREESYPRLLLTCRPAN